jgi:hypothetical protein
MRIQPRQQLLELWRAVARSSVQGNQWVWQGRGSRNSISDAEQLLCILGPATEIPTFKLDQPNETAEDVAKALKDLGDSIEIPRLLVGAVREFFETYAEDGAPTFGGGSYFTAEQAQQPSAAQLALDVVDSYAISVRLTLAVIGFLRVFRGVLSRQEILDEVDKIEQLAKLRLTAAMIGLLRGFAVYAYDADSDEGDRLIGMANQTGMSKTRVREALNLQFREIRARLRDDVSLGISHIPGLDNDFKLFECGWSWGIVKDAPPVKTSAVDVRQPEGVAQAAPYLYFTVVALDCIQNLVSERTRLLGLLDEEQQRLSQALQIRWELTQSYWSKLARFGPGRWPLEDMPWMTSDGVQSDYLGLLVSSILVQDLSNRTGAEPDAVRVAAVLDELAARSRITSRVLSPEDPAIALHAPGFPFELEGSEDAGGPRLRWELADFSPQLLKQTLRVAGLLRDVEERGRVVGLADRIWTDHLARRRLSSGSASALWDRPSALYPVPAIEDDSPSWYYTERVVGCLVQAAELVSSAPPRSPDLSGQAGSLLAEADHMFDQELLRMSTETGPSMRKTLENARVSLRRAHDVMPFRPGTAAAIAAQVLIELDRLDAARRNADGAH